MVRPSSCTVKGGIRSSRRYLPTYLFLIPNPGKRTMGRTRPTHRSHHRWHNLQRERRTTERVQNGEWQKGTTRREAKATREGPQTTKGKEVEGEHQRATSRRALLPSEAKATMEGPQTTKGKEVAGGQQRARGRKAPMPREAKATREGPQPTKATEAEAGHKLVRGRWVPPPREVKGTREGQRMASGH